MTDEKKLDRLPKWAQEHIADLKRERDTAVNAFRDYTDAQTKSSIYVTDYLCLGEHELHSGPSIVKHYIQNDVVHITGGGIEVEVRSNGDNKPINISWSDHGQYKGKILMRPTYSNCIELARYVYLNQ